MNRKEILIHLDTLIKRDKKVSAEQREALKACKQILESSDSKERIIDVLKILTNLLGIGSNFFK